jgi:rhomboid protease GluP
LGLNVVVFVAETILGGSENTATLVMMGAKVNSHIVMGEFWRLITPMFLHIGLPHILVNSYALFVLGPEVEALYGHSRFVTIYLLSGVAGNVMSFAFTPNLSAGASTAIFGLVGTQLAFFYRQRQTLGAFGQRRLMNIIAIVAINVLFGATGVVDNFGHLGGFLGGLVLGWLLCPAYEVEYGLDGQPRLADRNSLLSEWPGVALFIVLLVVATGVVTLQEAKRPQVKLEQGIAALRNGDYAGALPLLEQAAQELPTDHEAQYALAANYYNLRRYADAASRFEAILRLAPDSPDVHFYLAVSYGRLGHLSDAAMHLRQYLILAPDGEQADQARQLLSELQ